jgi:membrane protein DedA with SNARE-associated domain
MFLHHSSIPSIINFEWLANQIMVWQSFIAVLQRFFEHSYAQLSALKVWNYLLILAAVIIEGPVATVLGGVWAALGRVNLWGVLLVAMLAGILADSFWYYLGYFGRQQVLNRWGRLLRVDVDAINKMEEMLFGQGATRVLFLAKLTSAMVIPSLVAAGITRMGWRKVMRTVLMAQLMWSAGLTGLGYLMADSYRLISQKIENFGWIVGGLGVILLAGYLVYRWRKASEEPVAY